MSREDRMTQTAHSHIGLAFKRADMHLSPMEPHYSSHCRLYFISLLWMVQKLGGSMSEFLSKSLARRGEGAWTGEGLLVTAYRGPLSHCSANF